MIRVRFGFRLYFALSPLSQQIRGQNKYNFDWLVCVIPRLAPVSCMHFKFRLVSLVCWLGSVLICQCHQFVEKRSIWLTLIHCTQIFPFIIDHIISHSPSLSPVLPHGCTAFMSKILPLLPTNDLKGLSGNFEFIPIRWILPSFQSVQNSVRLKLVMPNG